MVKKAFYIFIFISFSFFWTQTAFAASFTASVDRKNVSVGESFTLELSLSGTMPKSAPDISALDENFTVYGTSQSSQTTIINNEVSSSINWHVTLIPKSEGSLTIPAIVIETDAGQLKSAPVEISASKASARLQNGEVRALLVDTEISKTSPYVNEPVLLSVRLIARKSISGIEIPDLTVENAIVDRRGDPEIIDGVLQGQRVKIIEVHYLVTPLQPGPIEIPGVMFQGRVESGQRHDPFAGRLGGGFADPFGMLDDFGFTSYRPFAVAGDATTLDVKPPAADITPWLPAYMVKLSERWEGVENAKVGEPITRTVTIIAEGVTSAALPSLEAQIAPKDDFNIYADKPVTGDNLGENGQSVGGWREESYTLIPQKPGALTLPEIRIAWWDILDKKIAYATIPARTIDVKVNPSLAAAAPASASAPQNTGPEKPNETAAPDLSLLQAGQEQNAASPVPAFLYAVIAGLGLVVIVMGGAVVYLLRRLARYEGKKRALNQPQTPRPANKDSGAPAALKKAQSPEELRAFLQNHAHLHWDLPRNAALQVIAAEIRARNPQADITAFSELDAALYAGAAIDMEEIKKRLHALVKATFHDQNKQEKPAKVTALNPS